MTKTKIKTTGCNRTAELPKTIVWREALRFLNVGDWFTASQLERTSIANQITFLKNNEEIEFKTVKITTEIFAVVRIDKSLSDKKIETLLKEIVSKELAAFS